MNSIFRFPGYINGEIKRFTILITAFFLIQFAYSAPENSSISTLDYDICLSAVLLQSPVCAGLSPVRFVVKNCGINSVDSAVINWSVNAVNQIGFSWSKPGGLASGTTDTVTVSIFNLPPGSVSFSGIISFTNGIVDSNLVNNSIADNILVFDNPHFTMQPSDQSTANGGDVSIIVQAFGFALYYQWQLSTNSGSTWTNILNMAPYMNVNTNTLHINNATIAMSGYKYRCVVTGECPVPAVSNAVILIVGDQILVKAGKVYACAGGIAIVPVTINNLVDITSFTLNLNFNQNYLIFLNTTALNTALSGGSWSATAANGVLTVTWFSSSPVSIASATLCNLHFTYYPVGNYPLIWDTATTGVCSFYTSTNLEFPSVYANGFVFNAAASITHQPYATVVSTHETARFTVSSSGAPTYQWQRSTNAGSTWVNLNNGVLPGGGSANCNGVFTDTLMIFQCEIGLSNNRFRCVLASCGNPVTSASAQLQVISKVITRIDSVWQCVGDTVIVPIKVWNFDSIASMSLVINYLPASLTCIGWQNWYPTLGNVFINNLNGQWRLAYWSLKNISIPDSSTMIELKFIYNGGCSALQWDTLTPGQCEYSDLNINTLPDIFHSGAVCDGLPEPAGNITGPATIVLGTDSVTYSVAAMPRVSSYNWTIPVGATIVSGAGTNTITVNFGGQAISGYLSVLGQNTCGTGADSSLFVNVLPSSSTIQGTLTYDNINSSPLSNCLVTLTGNSNSWQVSTDSAGYFEFNQLGAGTYTLVSSCTKPWGGVNAVDALLILKHFVSVAALQGLKLQAADTDGTGYVNSVDAMFALKRFVNLINSFLPGDWVSTSNTITIGGASTLTSNLKAICVGDVDGSFVPLAK